MKFLVRISLLSALLSSTGWSDKAPFWIKDEVVSVRAKPADGAEQVTQALLGDEVQVLEQRGAWMKVFVKPQYRTDKGYPGWLHSDSATQAGQPKDRSGWGVVSVPEARLRDEASAQGKTVALAPLGAKLARLSTDAPNGWTAVWLPGNKNPVFLQSSQLCTEEAPPADGRPIVETAAQLKGTHYLWGGMTEKGIDCSGLTYTAYRVHGITLPRDADQQFQIGEAVDPKDLKPGDLLFFGDSPKEITHVGMYMWQGKFIHASGSLGGVNVTPFTTPRYAAIFQGARRVLGSSKLIP